MEANRPRVDRAALAILPLAPENLSKLAAFECGDVDLDDFVRSDALRLQELKVARTYLAWFGARPVGYIALLADAVELIPKERKKLRGQSDPVHRLGFEDHPVVPALKIARLAIDNDFKQAQAGLGTELVRFAFLRAIDLSEIVGCRLLTVDAYPDAITFYEKLGFVPNKAQSYRVREHPSMRLDVFAPAIPNWVH